MRFSFGRGIFDSLRAYVNHEVASHTKNNATLRRNRYSIGRRLLRGVVVNRSIAQFLILYLFLYVVAMLVEWAVLPFLHHHHVVYPRSFDHGFFNDLSSYLVAGQIGILAIVSVAVGVVTLLSDRDDGSAINTDIRLYYVESYSYELAISGVALCMVLIVGLFWPVHHVLREFGYDRGKYVWSYLVISSLHAAWFCLNLRLFLQFVVTTLRFVEPSTREDLRETFTACEVIPRDARAELFAGLYLRAAQEMFPRDDGPLVTMGMAGFFTDTTTVEMTSNYRRRSELIDVRLRLLYWALNSWRTRVRQTVKPSNRYGQPGWHDHLAILPSPAEIFEGRFNIVTRRSSVSLNRREKAAIWLSLRFAPVKKRTNEAPARGEFLEQLITKLDRQIEVGALSGFKSALREVLRYHRFLLAAQNTTDINGRPFNIAQISTYLSSPESDWIHEYRHPFASAANKIGNDTSYINTISMVVSRLMPGDPINWPPQILTSILSLGSIEVHALQNWVTRHAVSEDSGGTINRLEVKLAATDKDAYEAALIGFVGGWEDALSSLVYKFPKKSNNKPDTDVEKWQIFSAALPVYQAHLKDTAYFEALTVWNGDWQGAARFRDMFLRWLNAFYSTIEYTFPFPGSVLHTPQIVRTSWPDVQAFVAGEHDYLRASLAVDVVCGTMLKEMHDDHICACALVILYWNVTEMCNTRISADAAMRTINREKLEGEGSDLSRTSPKSTFKLFFDFLIRYSLNPDLGEGRYGTTIENVLDQLFQISSKRLINGRQYGGFSQGTLDRVSPILLGALAATASEKEYSDGLSLIQEMENHPYLRSDRSITDFIFTFRTLARRLEDGDLELYRRSARLFGVNIDEGDATSKLNGFLDKIVEMFEKTKALRTKLAPLDSNYLASLCKVMSDALLELGPSMKLFDHVTLRRRIGSAQKPIDFNFGNFSRSAFIVGGGSQIFRNNVSDIFRQTVRVSLSKIIWDEFDRRSKFVRIIDWSMPADERWKALTKEADQVGEDPMLLLPWNRRGFNFLEETIEGLGPGGDVVTHEPNMPNGDGLTYQGTLGRIRVFSVVHLKSRVLLCSRRALHAIEFADIEGSSEITQFDIIEGDDITKCVIKGMYAPRLEWSDSACFDFRIEPIQISDDAQ